MTDIYKHPKPPSRHAATIVVAEIGCRVTCPCGWSAVAPTQGRATAAYMVHVRAEEAP